eukprot:3896813-Pyramimonas_sp.AAC.1
MLSVIWCLGVEGAIKSPQYCASALRKRHEGASSASYHGDSGYVVIAAANEGDDRFQRVHSEEKPHQRAGLSATMVA